MWRQRGAQKSPKNKNDTSPTLTLTCPTCNFTPPPFFFDVCRRGERLIFLRERVYVLPLQQVIITAMIILLMSALFTSQNGDKVEDVGFWGVIQLDSRDGKSTT